MMPEKLRTLFAPDLPWLTLTFDDQGISLVSQCKKQTIQHKIRFENFEDQKEDIQKHIRRFTKQNKKALIGLRLEPGTCFERSLEFPKDAKDKLPDIIRLDLERSTPFKTDQIYHDFYIEREEAQTIHVRHVIAKKTIVDPRIERIKTLSPTLDFVDVWSEPPRVSRRLRLTLR